MEKRKLAKIEQYIFERFREKGSQRLLTKDVFDSTPEFSNADLVRAFEDLEKKWRLLVRYTNEGNDWLKLTDAGAEYTGVNVTSDSDIALPHPPKSST